MSAHAILTAIEAEAMAFCSRRFAGTEDYLEAKDAHCKRVRSLVRKLRPMVGVSEMLSFGTGRRTFAGRSFEVIARIPAKGRKRA